MFRRDNLSPRSRRSRRVRIRCSGFMRVICNRFLILVVIMRSFSHLVDMSSNNITPSCRQSWPVRCDSSYPFNGTQVMPNQYGQLQPPMDLSAQTDPRGYYNCNILPVAPKKVCRFCRENGDRREFYFEHELRDPEGRLTCPILRSHTCEVCGATGGFAHTLSYCPLLKSMGKHKRRNAAALKKTAHDSCYRIRKLLVFY